MESKPVGPGDNETDEAHASYEGYATNEADATHEANETNAAYDAYGWLDSNELGRVAISVKP